jgi:hypothetical protein
MLHGESVLMLVAAGGAALLECLPARRCCSHGQGDDRNSFIAEKIGKTNLIDGDTPGLAATVGSVATLTVFRQLIRQPGPRYDQGGRNDRSQEVGSDAVTVVLLFAGKIVVGKSSVLHHHRDFLERRPQGSVFSPSSPAFFPKYTFL